MALTIKQKAINSETYEHIERVQELLNKMIVELLKRGEQHDKSKLTSPEVEIFAEFTPQLSSTTYDSNEYKKTLEAMKPAIEHHYANNRHHPEFFKNGINGMNLIDILEMLCDWEAASKRQNDGNIHHSLEINTKRFNIGKQLTQILENTVHMLN